MNWKYTDATHLVAFQTLANGQMVSSLVSALPNGTVIDAADPPPPPTQDQLDIAAANTYAKLVALKGMTFAQVQNYVQNNVTNLAQAQDAILTLAVAVSILARRL